MPVRGAAAFLIPALAALSVPLSSADAPETPLPRGLAPLSEECDPASRFPLRARREKDGAEMVLVPAGNFWMGCAESGDAECGGNEKPGRDVHLAAYYMDKLEITNGRFRKFCDATRRKHPPDPEISGKAGDFLAFPEYPVVKVSWHDASGYCEWAGGRLPGEAEWEKAARGTDGRIFPWGGELPGAARANCSNCGDPHARAAPAGNYPAGASPYGALDMAGNVWEWCRDWFDERRYERAAGDAPAAGEFRVLRGGSWFNPARNVRASYRFRYAPDLWLRNAGFRCAVSAETPAKKNP